LKGVILISGRGSNMRSIVDGATGLDVRAVISNRPHAPGLEWAREKGMATHGVDHTQYGSREEFDDAIAEVIDQHAPDLILLAGFMRVFGPRFIGRYPRRIVNIHPSLLPAFPGLHTHRQALAAGVKVHGATVHVVTAALDHGPVIVQGAVPVLPGDTEETLADRVLHVEHRIYPQAVRWFVEGRIEFVDGEVVQVRGTGHPDEMLISPRNIE
jgi:phosphoribosylglycinamide formyltransferase-1